MNAPVALTSMQRGVLHLDKGGEVRIRWGALSVGLIVSALAAGCLLFVSQQLDAWYGPPLIVGGFVALLVWHFVRVRQLLRAARTPEKSFTMPLVDLFLITTAVAIFATGYSVNDRRRSAELVRRAEVQQAALEIMGPHAEFERDHRAKVWLTIGDPTFDDARLTELLNLLEDDRRRYGVTQLMFVLVPGTQISPEAPPLVHWPGLTDQSVEPIASLTLLSELWLQGTAISSRGAERLLELPNLRSFSTSEPFDDDVAAAAFESNSNLSLMDGPGWPERRLPRGASKTPATPPLPPVAGPPPPANPGWQPGLPGSGGGSLSPSLPGR